MSETAASELVERLRAKRQAVPPFGSASMSSDGKFTCTISDDGKRLVNPDGPAAADLIDSLQRENAVLREALGKHGKHKRGCSVFPRRTRHLAQCSCGLSVALNRGGAG